MNKWVYAARFVGVGFFIAGSIILGIVFGIWLDNKLHTSFIWVIGLLAGMMVAFWGVYRMLIPLMYKDKDNHKRGS